MNNKTDKTHSKSREENMKSNRGLWISGAIFVIIGVFFPREWYDILPKPPEMPQLPIKGVTLLQICFVVEGLALILLYLRRWNFVSLKETETISVITEIEDDKFITKRNAIVILSIITSLAFVLRLIKSDSDLWLDEIVSITTSIDSTPLQIIGSYLKSNNHLLNSLLIKVSIAFFGEKEWAARLPAIIFGTATIPVIYWVSRMILSKIASLGVAILLAVSYHHIFFSQNARGYSAYLFFSILATGLFVKALKDDQAKNWIFYITAMFFNFASLLISLFVLGSHFLIGSIIIFKIKRKGIYPIPVARRLIGVFAITSFVSFQLYAAIVPQAYVVMKTVYASPSAGFSPFSAEFIKEIIRGVSAGFGPFAVFGAFLFLAIAIPGFVSLARRNWILVLTFVLPIFITALCLIAKGLTISPRFFLLALPFTILVAVESVCIISKVGVSLVGKRDSALYSRVAIVLILVASVVSLVSLVKYYSIPKQPYRASIEYIETIKQPDDIVLVIHLAEIGYRYYCNQLDIRESGNYFFVRSLDKLNKVLHMRSKKSVYLVTTFPRALHIVCTDLERRIKENWTIINTFPATIGDGHISIWAEKNNNI